MYYAPWKKLEVRNCLFDMMTQIAFTFEGANIDIQNVSINVTRTNSIGGFVAIPQCHYILNQGIGNNIILNNIKFFG